MKTDNRPIYFTTPIYYVNDKPHVGHAYTTIVADFLKRAQKILGRESFFLTGTDEHGARIAEVARANGKTPQEWCDIHSQHFRDAWKRLDIEYDYFIRTTDQRHVRGVEKLLEKLKTAKTATGEPAVYEGTYKGLYCLGCEKFITEKELVDGLCPQHLTKPQEISEKNYFFRLTAYLKQVEELIRAGTIKILPTERKNEVLGLFKQGLEDLSISREKVDWGIPLPWDPSQNAYVWVDALPNYITAIGYEDNPEQFAKWWTGGQTLHLMAKDILKFHAIFWPAMLLAIGEQPPETIFIHGYFTVNGQKMSKTLRNAIDPHVMVDQFGADGARYLLLTQFQFGQDGDLKADEFVRQFNADLANDLGNLVSRTVTLIQRHFDGGSLRTSSTEGPFGESVSALRRLALSAAERFESGVDSLSPNDAIGAGLSLVSASNRFFDDAKPWDLAKRDEHEALGTVLAVTAELIRISAIILTPVIPQKSRQILKTLGFLKPETELTREGLFGWDRCPGPFRLDAPIFPRLEKTELKASEKPPVTEATTTLENVVTIDQFRHTQLCTAEVLSAEKVEGADKLLKLQLAVGEERRQIVAGIALHYKPEELVGKTIVIVANLKPSKIRGIESQGMLLAASAGKALRLLTTDGVIESGSSIG